MTRALRARNRVKQLSDGVCYDLVMWEGLSASVTFQVTPGVREEEAAP